MFNYSQAISRIEQMPESVWTPGLSSDQKLQVLNMVLEYLWTWGEWDGLIVDVTGLTTSSGILTLPAQYKSLTALSIPDRNEIVSIKSQSWKLSPSAPRIGDWTKYSGCPIAFDLGDTGTAELGVFAGQTIKDGVTGTFYNIVVNNGVIGIEDAGDVPPPSSSSARQYQLAGDPTEIDALAFFGQAKRRYIWATDTSAIVVPDVFEAVLEGVRAFHWLDVGDVSRAEKHFQRALNLLESDAKDIADDEDFGSVSIDYASSGGSIPNII